MNNTTLPEGFQREVGPGGLEARAIKPPLIEARTADNGVRRIEGLASVYTQRTTIPGWWMEWDEEVAQGAWANTIEQKSKSTTEDVRSMFNHDINWLLGRQANGTLRLESQGEGLFYSVDINPDDPQAMSVFAKVERADVTGASVWFRVISEQWTEPTKENGLERALRVILEAELFEGGPVVWPAFPQTTAAAARSLDGMLLAAGVTKENKRASIASDLLADPSGMEERIRELFARQPALRGKVCGTETCSCQTAADAPAPQPHWAVAARSRQLDLSRR